MKFNNSRQLQILYLLMESGRFITSEELSTLVKVSIRTIKNDIKVIRTVVREMGIEIISKQGSGYLLKYDNVYEFEKLKKKIYMKHNSVWVIQTDSENRINYVVRCLLGAKKYIKLETIANGLYLTPKALDRDIAFARNKLNDYNIKVLSKPGYGLYLSYKEYDYRICMVDYFEFFHHKTEPTFESENYFSAFDYNHKERCEIRNIILDYFYRNNISIPDYCMQKFVINILFTRARDSKENIIDISNNSLKLIKSFTEFKHVSNIIEEINIFKGFDNIQEKEIAFLSIFLICGRDELNSIIDEPGYICFKEEAHNLYKKLVNWLNDSFKINLDTYIEIKDDFIQYLLQLLIRIKFRIRYISGTPAKKSHLSKDIRYNPVVMYLSLEISEFLEKELIWKFSSEEIVNLATIISNIMKNIKLKYDKSNIILIPENNKSSMREISKKLYFEFPEQIRKIDTCELYQLRNCNFDKYDVLISAHKLRDLNFNIKYLYINYYLKYSDLENLYRSIFVDKINVLKEFNYNKLFRTYKKYEIVDIDQFINQIICKYSDCQEDEEVWKKIFEKYNIYGISLVYNQLLLIYVPFKLAKENKIECYQFIKGYSYGNNIVKYAIVVSINFNNEQKLKFAELFGLAIIDRKFNINNIYERNYKDLLHSIFKLSNIIN